MTDVRRTKRRDGGTALTAAAVLALAAAGFAAIAGFGIARWLLTLGIVLMLAGFLSRRRGVLR